MLRGLASMGRRGPALLFAGASAAMLLFQIGYVFEAGDQLQYLLLPYREMFADFLPGDWFTWHTSHYHQTYAWVIRAIHGACGATHFAHGVFVVHVLNLAWFGYALLRLARALGLGHFEAAFAVATFALVRQIGLGGAVVNHEGLVPADLALAPFLLACAAYAERRTLWLGVHLGIAGFLHANYAALGPLALFPLAAGQCWQDVTSTATPAPWPQTAARNVLQLVAAVALFTLIALPTLWLMIIAFIARDSAPQAVALTLFVRSPHHYDLASLRHDEFYYATVLALATLPFLLGQVGPTRGRAAHLQLMASLSAVVALGVVGSGLHVLPLARLFPWRMSIPLFALCLFGVARALSVFVQRRELLRALWLVGLCFVMTCFAQTDPLESSPWTSLHRAAAYGGGLLVLATLLVVLRAGVLRRVRELAGVAITLLAAALAWSVVHTDRWQGPQFVRPRGLHLFDARIALTTPARPLFTLIRDSTPPDARFLIPPGQSQFRLQARRAIFVDWKCTPMKGDEALEWQRRMLAAMGTTEFPTRGYALPRASDSAYFARPLADLANLARREGMTHILARRDARPAAGLKRTLQFGPLAVYELLPP
jgi:hypothetical protein